MGREASENHQATWRCMYLGKKKRPTRRGHLKWWFSYGNPPQIPLIQGLGIILICPECIPRHPNIPNEDRCFEPPNGR